MLVCSKCKKKAVSTIPLLCKEHFVSFVEKKVGETIKKFGLIKKSDNVLVATSGGKDSLTTLFILKKLGYDPTGLLIDEGIGGYREKTVSDMEEFSKKHGVSFVKKSFKEEHDFSLDAAMKKLKGKISACHLCGVLRRRLLNKYSKKYDVIATGHNLDDEAQSIVMNILKTNLTLMPRLGPISGVIHDEKFTKRVKPLYFLSEKQIKTYIFLQGISNVYTMCPYTATSFRNDVQDWLNKIEQEIPDTKINVVNHYLRNQRVIKENTFVEGDKISKCVHCFEPTNHEKCNACLLVESLQKKVIS